MRRQKWDKNLIAYPLPATKGPVHTPQLVFFALVSCTRRLGILHHGPS